MTSSFAWVASGGAEGGGVGIWGSERNPGCNLVVTDSGLVVQLDLLRTAWETKYQVGLFQADVFPKITSTIVELLPCDFSGYVGLQTSFGWSGAVVDGTRSNTLANALTWTHDGGPITNFVYGYYIVDKKGFLMWAERFCPGPVWMDRPGRSVRVRPAFTLRNDVPE